MCNMTNLDSGKYFVDSCDSLQNARLVRKLLVGLFQSRYGV